MPERPRLTLVPGGRPAGPDRAPGAPTGAGPPDLAAARELTALGTGLVLVCVLLARLDGWRQSLGTFQSLVAVAFVFLVLALWRTRARTIPRAGWIVFVVALATRVALLPVTPSLSDDIYRYVWEGRVVAHGGDPYHAAPSDSALAPLRDRVIHPRINHPELASIYPPLSLAGFALVAWISPTVVAMKTWVVLNDLAVVALLLAWARRRGFAPQAVAAYAWNPLVVVEHAGSGHHDPVAIVWLVAAFVLTDRRPVLAALALAAGVLTKLAPLVALPFLLARWPWRARAVALLTIVPGLAVFWLATRGASSGLDAYSRSWANNELAFAALAWLAGDLWRARLVAGVLVAALALTLMWRGREAAGATRTVLRAGFLLSPVAHPWYLGWVMAFEPLGPSAPWLLLSFTAFLSYGVLAPPGEAGRFHLPIAWRLLEYGLPLLLALALGLVRRPRSRSSG